MSHRQAREGWQVSQALPRGQGKEGGEGISESHSGQGLSHPLRKWLASVQGHLEGPLGTTAKERLG